MIKKISKKKFLIKKKNHKNIFFFVPQFRILFSGIPQKVEKNLKFRFLGRKMDFPLFRSFHIPQKSKNIPWNSARGIRFLVPTKKLHFQVHASKTSIFLMSVRSPALFVFSIYLLISRFLQFETRF